MVFNGETKVLGIMGNPVNHSLSPIFWNAAFSELDINAVYVPFPVDKEQIGAALTGIRALSVLGVNVTKPYKESVVPYLSSLHASAERLRVVNTIKVRKNGEMEGFNTDLTAFLSIFDENYNKGPVTLLGAGGAGKTVFGGLCQRGCEMIYWFNRTPGKQQILFPVGKTSVRTPPWEEPELRNAMSKSTMIINTTSLGWAKDDWMPGFENSFGPETTYWDLNYGGDSRLISHAKKIGAKVINGIDFLLHQGAEAFEILLDRQPPKEIMRKSLNYFFQRNEPEGSAND